MSFPSNEQPLAVGLAAPWTLPEALHELPVKIAATLVGQLIGPFQTDTAERTRRARCALAKTDMATFRAEVHSMKGSASQMGADAMASLCLEMESAIGKVATPQLLESLDRLESHVRTAVDAMTAYSRTSGSASAAG